VKKELIDFTINTCVDSKGSTVITSPPNYLPQCTTQEEIRKANEKCDHSATIKGINKSTGNMGQPIIHEIKYCVKCGEWWELD